ncbi:MAG: uracil-DNA glycosylase [Anaerolineaceae bacterium]|nr:uracil-DNA glycosylase [Anaerolineaceae bacterium]
MVHTMELKDETVAGLQALEAEVTACRRCPRLVEWREAVALRRRRAYRDWDYWGKPVPGFGDPHARLLVVGLAPGAHGSNRTGRMFTGDASGDFLYRALHRAGFASQSQACSRDDGLGLLDMFISAVCRCVPPGNKPTRQEVVNCLPFLRREIDLLPNLQGVIALGRIAFDNLIMLHPPLEDAHQTANFFHLAQYPLGDGRLWLLASYHPSRQNTQTGRLTTAMFDAVWAQARSLLDDQHIPRSITK